MGSSSFSKFLIWKIWRTFPPLKREIFVTFTIQKQKISKISQIFVINFLIKKTLNLSQHQGFIFLSLFFSNLWYKKTWLTFSKIRAKILSNHENRWFSLLNPKPKHLKLTVIKTPEYPPVHNKYRAPTAILLLHAPTHPPRGFSFIHFVMYPKWWSYISMKI